MNRFWEPFLLGVLADDEDVNGFRSVFVNNANELQFSIRIISTLPSSFPDNQQVITCWGSDLQIHGFEDNSFDNQLRIENLLDFLERKLLVFQVEKKGYYYSAKNIKILPKKRSFSDTLSFSPIPIFNETTEDSDNWETFIKNLNQGHYVGRNDSISQEPKDTPRFLFYKTLDNDYFAVGAFESHQYAYGGFRFYTEDDAVKSLKVEQTILKEVYIWKNLAFIGLDEEHHLLSNLLQSEATEFISESAVETNYEEKNANPTEDEAAFMSQFIEETKKRQLLYKKEDLYNVHTSIKTGDLTILAGLSGTGKSQLLNAYQKSLHLNPEHFLMIPVSPSWTDDTDLLGYPDMVNHVFRPARSGIVNLLLKAEKNPEETFMICFDDMNIAKVEHYFAQFLSVLEMVKEHRKITLYNKDLQEKFFNGATYPAEISIGDNVIFAGTVSSDESSHPISDKMLDRANLITLQVEPFENLLPQMALKDSEMAFLWEVHQALTSISSNLGIGPRIVKQIDRYIKNLPDVKDCPIDRKQAFDLQFSQRVLSKIRGSEEMLQNLVGFYDEEKQTVIHSQLVDLFNRYASYSNFTKSKALIVDKAKELMRNGYAL